MPSTSAKQHRFMAAIANSPSFAKKVGVSQSVGKDFNAADKGKTFNKGGMMKESKGMNMGGMMKNSAMKKGDMPMKDGKPAFMQKKMMGGGMAKYAKGGGIESRGKTKGTMVRMATGGSVSSASRRADGIAQRGKTKC